MKTLWAVWVLVRLSLVRGWIPITSTYDWIGVNEPRQVGPQNIPGVGTGRMRCKSEWFQDLSRVHAVAGTFCLFEYVDVFSVLWFWDAGRCSSLCFSFKTSLYREKCVRPFNLARCQRASGHGLGWGFEEAPLVKRRIWMDLGQVIEGTNRVLESSTMEKGFHCVETRV